MTAKKGEIIESYFAINYCFIYDLLKKSYLIFPEMLPFKFHHSPNIIKKLKRLGKPIKDEELRGTEYDITRFEEKFEREHDIGIQKHINYKVKEREEKESKYIRKNLNGLKSNLNEIIEKYICSIYNMKDTIALIDLIMDKKE